MDLRRFIDFLVLPPPPPTFIPDADRAQEIPTSLFLFERAVASLRVGMLSTFFLQFLPEAFFAAAQSYTSSWRSRERSRSFLLCSSSAPCLFLPLLLLLSRALPAVLTQDVFHFVHVVAVLFLSARFIFPLLSLSGFCRASPFGL